MNRIGWAIRLAAIGFGFLLSATTAFAGNIDANVDTDVLTGGAGDAWIATFDGTLPDGAPGGLPHGTLRLAGTSQEFITSGSYSCAPALIGEVRMWSCTTVVGGFRVLPSNNPAFQLGPPNPVDARTVTFTGTVDGDGREFQCDGAAVRKAGGFDVVTGCTVA